MKKILFGVLSIILSFTLSSVNCEAQNVKKEGKTFIQSSSRGDSSKDIQTTYIFKDTKGNEYPIILHQYSKGDKAGQWTAYIIKKSAKTGNEYKSYLTNGVEIAKTIREEMGLK